LIEPAFKESCLNEKEAEKSMTAIRAPKPALYAISILFFNFAESSIRSIDQKFVTPKKMG
jgi:hypothetical protein